MAGRTHYRFIVAGCRCTGKSGMVEVYLVGDAPHR